MTSLVSETGSFSDAVGKSKADANAFPVLRTLAGRVRLLAELVMGSSMASGEDPVSQRNPDGQIGVNFSGPPFGSCWRRPVFVMGGLKPDVLGAGQWGGHREVRFTRSADEIFAVRIRLYQRPFSPRRGAPLSRVYPVVSLYADSGVPFDVVLRCRPKTGSPSDTRSATISVTSTAEDFPTMPSGLYWDVVPGINELEFVVDTTGAPSVVHLVSLTGNQIVKRSH